MTGFRFGKILSLSLAVLTLSSLVACSQAAPSPQAFQGTAAQLPSPHPTSSPRPNLPATSENGDTTALAGFEPGHSAWINRYQDNVPVYGQYVLPTSDGAVLVLAWREGQPWVLKISADGAVQWQIVLDVFALHSMVETQEGNYVLFGPYHIVSIDADGQVLWQRSFSRDIDQAASISVSISAPTFLDVDQTSGGWVIADDLGLLTYINPDGMLAHQTFYQGEPTYTDAVIYMSPTGLAVTAQSGRGDFIVEHYGLNDNNHWRRVVSFKTQDLPTLTPYFLIGGDDQGGLLFGGPVYSYLIDGGVDLYLVKLDLYGSIEWQRVIEGTTSLEFVQAFQMRDGGFLITATRWGFYAESDEYLPYLWLIRLNPQGEILWQRIVGDGASTLHVRHAIEIPNGDLIMTGDISPGESHNLSDQSELLLIKVDSDGQIPGCAWLQTVNHAGETVEASLGLDPLDAIDHEQANFEWQEDQPNLPQSTQTIPEQICMNLPGFVIPIPTHDPLASVPTQANQTYVFLNSDGYLFGGVRDKQWLDPEAASEAMVLGQPVSVYSNEQLVGQSMVTLLTNPGQYNCDQSNQFGLHPAASGETAVGINGPWQAAPRHPADIDIETEPYPAVLGQILADLGLADPISQISSLQRIDLDNNATDEVIMTAFRLQYGINSAGVAAGDYSLVVLRRIGDDGVVDTPLVSDVYLQTTSTVNPIRYRVIGLLDLNADGVLEIIIEGTSLSELVILVFDVTAPTYEPVISLSCLSS